MLILTTPTIQPFLQEMRENLNTLDDFTDRLINYSCEAIDIEQITNLKDMIEFCERKGILPPQGEEKIKELEDAVLKYLQYVNDEIKDVNKLGINIINQLKPLFNSWFTRDSLKKVAEANSDLIKEIRDTIARHCEEYFVSFRKKIQKEKDPKQKDFKRAVHKAQSGELQKFKKNVKGKTLSPRAFSFLTNILTIEPHVRKNWQTKEWNDGQEKADNNLGMEVEKQKNGQECTD